MVEKNGRKLNKGKKKINNRYAKKNKKKYEKRQEERDRNDKKKGKEDRGHPARRTCLAPLASLIPRFPYQLHQYKQGIKLKQGDNSGPNCGMDSEENRKERERKSDSDRGRNREMFSRNRETNIGSET